MSTMREVAELQEQYRTLLENRKLSKKALCDLCIPFRDKYGLTDLQTLQITRNELSLIEIVELLEKTISPYCSQYGAKMDEGVNYV